MVNNIIEFIILFLSAMIAGNMTYIFFIEKISRDLLNKNYIIKYWQTSCLKFIKYLRIIGLLIIILSLCSFLLVKQYLWALTLVFHAYIGMYVMQQVKLINAQLIEKKEKLSSNEISNIIHIWDNMNKKITIIALNAFIIAIFATLL